MSQATSAAWAKGNPERVKAYGLKWREKNRERLAAYSREWAKLHPDKNRARSNAWARANPEENRAKDVRSYARHSAARRASAKTWRDTHREMRYAAEAKRRARKLNSPGPGVSAAEWKQIISDGLGVCAYCNEHRALTLDHIEPLVLGGAHCTSNMAAVCRSCNGSKSRQPLLLWLVRRGPRIR